jgi:hypothetical protein
MEAVLWTFFGVIVTVVAVLGLIAAVAMGRAPYNKN